MRLRKNGSVSMVVHPDLSWFVLKYLLGYPNVESCNGSMTEWANLVRTPIEN